MLEHGLERLEIGVHVRDDDYAHQPTIAKDMACRRIGAEARAIAWLAVVGWIPACAGMTGCALGRKEPCTYNRCVLVSEIGEFGLIKLLAQEFGIEYPPKRGGGAEHGLQVGLGDDAVVTARRDGAMIWTTDTMVARLFKTENEGLRGGDSW